MLAVLRRELRRIFYRRPDIFLWGFPVAFGFFLYVFQFISSQPKLSWRIGQHNIYIPDSGSHINHETDVGRKPSKDRSASSDKPLKRNGIVLGKYCRCGSIFDNIAHYLSIPNNIKLFWHNSGLGNNWRIYWFLLTWFCIYFDWFVCIFTYR